MYVVTVTRNNWPGLKRTLESVLAQTEQPTAIYVIDGASSDGTVEEMSAITYPHLHFRSEPDSGIYNAMNKGLGNCGAQGVVNFLNAGDVYADNRVLEDIQKLFRPTDAVVYGDIFYGPTKTLVPQSWRGICRVRNVCHQAVFYDVAALRRIGGYDERFRICADFAALVRLDTRFGRPAIRSIKRPVVIYEGGGVSESAMMLRSQERRQIIRSSDLSVVERTLSMAAMLKV